MIIVYSKSNCPNCVTVKNLLDRNKIIYEVKDVMYPEVRNELLTKNPNARMMPQVFDGDKLIGSNPTDIKRELNLQ